jgi:hypothetical protein
MDTGSLGESNTLDLIGLIQSMAGETFAQKCADAEKVLRARMSRVGRGSEQWHRLIKTLGLVGGFIRFDGDVPLEDEVTESALAA